MELTTFLIVIAVGVVAVVALCVRARGANKAQQERNRGMYAEAAATGAPPTFPLEIWWYDPSGTLESTEVVDNETELACQLEWFNSFSSDGTIRVTDALGRPVTVVIENTNIQLLKV